MRFTIRAGPPASSGRSRFTSTKWPRWLVPNWVSKPSAVRPSGVAITPALAMITSRRSWSASTPSVNARTEASDARSTSRSSTAAPVAAAAARTGSAARFALLDVAHAEHDVAAVRGDRARRLLARARPRRR